MKAGWRPAVAGAVLVLHGCATVSESDGPPDDPPLLEEILAIPEPVPQREPRSRYGNPDSYQVYGRTYRVLESSEGFRERGHASWYGRKFHGRRTSSGEPYDMLALTAAHKTLPLPAYVRVTHLASGRSLVVRVNDRGPFHDGRIIDLSYAAAARLGILGQGAAEVEIAVLTPHTDVQVPRAQDAQERPPHTDVQVPRAQDAQERPPGEGVPEPTPTPPFEAPAPPPEQIAAAWLDAGTFGDPINAVALREQIAALGMESVEIRIEDDGDSYRHRVLVGPFVDPEAVAQARERLLAGRISTELFAP